jgi:hypothetical protein
LGSALKVFSDASEHAPSIPATTGDHACPSTSSLARPPDACLRGHVEDHIVAANSVLQTTWLGEVEPHTPGAEGLNLRIVTAREG